MNKKAKSCQNAQSTGRVSRRPLDVVGSLKFVQIKPVLDGKLLVKRLYTTIGIRGRSGLVA